MRYHVIARPDESKRIDRHLHSVFFEYFGRVIYDGIWVGKDSAIPNTDGLRQDVIDGCRELGVGAMRWPGGCCADHYHWKDGVGEERLPRLHPIPEPANPVWRHEFGTDEFLRLCELTGADPIITVNTATGTPQEFLDWYEYVNGDVRTRYGRQRAANGHPEPYHVRYWAMGNTDENVWHVDFNDPENYARRYRQFLTVVRNLWDEMYIIGLGLSARHRLPGWTGKSLDYLTHGQRERGPDALSVHHYLGGMKQGRGVCGDSVDFTDEQYYNLLALLERYEYDITLHRVTIREHTDPRWPTKICFDEWGVWHPEADTSNNQNQRQTIRDALFAALTLHIFYRNADIVDFAMETQLSNLLQSLFETDGPHFYKTPTFHAMRLLKEHLGQRLIPLLPEDVDDMLDAVATMSDDGGRITISFVNRDLYEMRRAALCLPQGDWHVVQAELLTAADVHDCNSFEEPEKVSPAPFTATADAPVELPPHSLVRICLAKKEQSSVL